MNGSFSESLKGRISVNNPISVALSLTDVDSISAVMSTVGKLQAADRSVLVSLRGPVSSVLSLVETIRPAAESSISVMLSVRGDRPAATK